jgi:cell wall-associated protease
MFSNFPLDHRCKRRGILLIKKGIKLNIIPFKIYFMKIITIMFLSFLITGCSVSQNTPIQVSNNIISKKLTKEEKINWQHRDIIKDTIAGISLERATEELLNNKEGDTIIIAIIDSPIDTEHEYLKNNIWTNTKEIANNGIDDDGNGYIDDIHGWNFMGNSKGENSIYSNMEFTRILKKHEPLFKTKPLHEIKDKEKYKLYEKALKSYDSMVKYSNEQKEYFTMIHTSYYDAEKKISNYFSNNNYSITQLDSLKLLHPKDTTLQSAILRMSNFKEYFGKDYIDQNYNLFTNHVNILFNKNHNDRETIGDDAENINDINYGNNIINHNVDILTHGTLVSGTMVVSETIKNEVQGVLVNAKIMPLCISGYGNEHDKDIALAVRYAVDNGAKVINMSFGKMFSLHKKWVFEAFKYAEEHNVLIVSSAGNNSLDLSKVNNYYPNDNVNNGKEVSSNFLLVGTSSYRTNERLASSFSNYGKTDVDIFAPGIFIYTTTVNNKYEFQRGTSMSASITSGVAALIFSHYPNLSAAEVKQIIMESGVSFDIMVNKPSTSKEKELVPFSSLSKSGKIVNAYNALLMAEKVSKKKKKRN